jgi:hypothetical protein
VKSGEYKACYHTFAKQNWKEILISNHGNYFPVVETWDWEGVDVCALVFKNSSSWIL